MEDKKRCREYGFIEKDSKVAGIGRRYYSPVVTESFSLVVTKHQNYSAQKDVNFAELSARSAGPY